MGICAKLVRQTTKNRKNPTATRSKQAMAGKMPAWSCGPSLRALWSPHSDADLRGAPPAVRPTRAETGQSMSRSNNGVAAKRFWRPTRWSTTIASTTALALGLSLASGVGTAAADTVATSAGPVVTRAALGPAPGAGRGATVDFAEQEAEKAVTNGTVIGPGTDAYTLPAEASGRSAVTLAPGQYVEFTLPGA